MDLLPQKINRKQFYFFIVIFIFSVVFLPFANADENQTVETANIGYNLNLDKKTIDRGYTVEAFNKIKISLTPGILSSTTDVEIINLKENLETPWQLDLASEFYQFEFKNKLAYQKAVPFIIEIKFEKTSNDYKQVFFYDKKLNLWRPLPTKELAGKNTVRTLIHLPFARLAVFSYPKILSSGIASWYKYKNGNFAASPDFPAGSRLRVFNTSNNKFVDVTINDYGPNRLIHPDRVLDLDKIAFQKIAALADGGAKILIEPLYIPAVKGQILNIPVLGAAAKIETKTKSAIIFDEKLNEVIWQKNSTTTLPLASLTKLVAVKTFLDTKPSLNQTAVYKKQDEEWNNKYCKPWESAKLKVSDGETLTIADLIYSSLVGSANNTVESLVRISGLTRDNFIAKMNDNVKSWGASTTKFVEPTGLSPENVSSALDYAIITKEVFTNPIIQKASVMATYSFSTINTKKSHTIKNTNNLIRSSKFDITGSKTGYLDEAGYCLMTRIKTGANNLIIVTFGAQSKEESVNETEKLIYYGLRKIKI